MPLIRVVQIRDNEATYLISSDEVEDDLSFVFTFSVLWIKEEFLKRELTFWWILAVILFCILAYNASAQTDNYNGAGNVSPYLTLGRGLQWGGIGFGTVGQNFIFNPLDPNQGFCVFIFNNNPANSHSFTLTVAQTGDPAVRSYAGNLARWTNVPTQQSFPVSIAASSLVGINYKTTASAGIVISFTGNTSAGGSPDTADIFTVQTSQSSCGNLPVNTVQGPFLINSNVTTANDFPVLVGGVQNPGTTSFAETAHIGTHGNGWLLDGGACCQSFASGFVSTPSSTFSNLQSATGSGTEVETAIDNLSMGFIGAKGMAPGFLKTNFLEIATDMFFLTQSQTVAFSVLGKVTNPGANATIVHNFNQVSGTSNPAYKNLTLSCSAVCELVVNRTSAQGTTCTALTAKNLSLGNAGTVGTPVATDVSENACATQPTATFTIYDLALPAGGATNIDLSGFTNFHSASNGAGIDVVNVTAIASGFVTATLTWMEQ